MSSASSSYHIGPKVQPIFSEGIFIPWRPFSGSGGLSGTVFWGHFFLGIEFFLRGIWGGGGGEGGGGGGVSYN